MLNTEDVGLAIQTLVMNYLAGNVHTAMPGRVESYNATKRTADIKPLLKRAEIDGTQAEYPVLHEVPVAVYGTAGAGIELPIASGDFVLLIFSERSTDLAMETGKTSNTTFNRQYHMSDAIALPGLFPRSWSKNTTGSGDVTIYNNGGKTIIKASGDIELGEGVLQAVANNVFVTAICTALQGLGVPGMIPVPPTFLTSKVKAQ